MLGRSVVVDLRKCSVKLGAVWTHNSYRNATLCRGIAPALVQQLAVVIQEQKVKQIGLSGKTRSTQVFYAGESFR